MKKIFLIFTLLILISACDDNEKKEYMNRHSKNYDNLNTITVDDYINTTGIPPYKIPAQKYDAEEFRAGAMALCSFILENTGKDTCKETGYWGLVGPRVK